MGTIRQRATSFRRRTRGTEVSVEFKLDGAGHSEVETPFETLNMLLEMMCGHGGMDLRMTQRLNEHSVDEYAMDDLATALAEALNRSLGPRPKIRQFGSETLPVGDCLVMVAVDLVSPPVFEMTATFGADEVDGFDIELMRRFLATLVDRLGAALHVRVLAGRHDRNKVRAIFLAMGRAIGQAIEPADREGAREVAADVEYDELAEAGGDGDTPEPSERSEPEPGRGRSRRGGRGGRPLPDASDAVDVLAAVESEEEEPAGSLVDSEADNDEEDDGKRNGRRRRRGRRGGRGRRRRGGDDLEPEGAQLEAANGTIEETDDEPVQGGRMGTTEPDEENAGDGSGRRWERTPALAQDEDEEPAGAVGPTGEVETRRPRGESPGRPRRGGRGRPRLRTPRGHDPERAPAETPASGADSPILDFVTGETKTGAGSTAPNARRRRRR